MSYQKRFINQVLEKVQDDRLRAYASREELNEGAYNLDAIEDDVLEQAAFFTVKGASGLYCDNKGQWKKITGDCLLVVDCISDILYLVKGDKTLNLLKSGSILEICYYINSILDGSYNVVDKHEVHLFANARLPFYLAVDGAVEAQCVHIDWSVARKLIEEHGQEYFISHMQKWNLDDLRKYSLHDKLLQMQASGELDLPENKPKGELLGVDTFGRLHLGGIGGVFIDQLILELQPGVNSRNLRDHLERNAAKSLWEDLKLCCYRPEIMERVLVQKAILPKDPQLAFEVSLELHKLRQSINRHFNKSRDLMLGLLREMDCVEDSLNLARRNWNALKAGERGASLSEKGA